MSEHKRWIDIGVELGAKNGLCVSSDPDLSATAARLAELCVHAEGGRIRVALEFGVFTEVKTIGMARAVLDAVEHPLRALLIDPIHVDRSGATAAVVAAAPPPLLPYWQFFHASPKPPNPQDFNAVLYEALALAMQV